MQFTELIAPIKRRGSLRQISTKKINSSNFPKILLFGDMDRDGWSNLFDCEPYNPKKQGGQYDQLTKNISSLPPQVQQVAYSALKSGKYGAVNIKAKEQGGDYAKAKVYLDTFFNTAEGRRYDASSYSTPYSSLFANPGQTNIKKVTIPTRELTPPSGYSGKTTKPVYGPQQQYVVGYDTQGNKVYSPTKPSTPYVAPTYFTSSGNKGVSYYSSVSGTPTAKVMQQKTIFSESAQPQVISKREISTISQQRKLSVVDLPPSEKQYFQEAVSREGFFGGTRSYLSGFTQRKYLGYETSRRLKDPSYLSYQPQATSRLIGGATTLGLYSIPYVGETMLIGEGTETYGTSAGRERLKEQSEKIGKSAYLIPAAEIGLGGLGLGVKFKGIKTTKDIEKAQTKFIAGTEEVEGGTKVRMLSQTDIGKKNYFATQNQLFKQSEEGSLIGIGRGYSFEVQKGYNPLTQKFERKFVNVNPILSSGKVEKLGEAKIVKEVGGLKVSKPIEESTFLSRGLTKTGKETPQQYRSLGISTGSGNIQRVVATTKPKLRIYRKGDLSYTMKEPNVRGYILRSGETEKGFTGELATVKKSPITKQVKQTATEFASTSQKAAQETAKARIPKVPNTFTGLVSPVISRTQIKTRTRQLLSQSSSQRQNQPTKTLLSQSTSQAEKESQTPFVNLITGQIPSQRQPQGVLSSQPSAQETRQLQRTPSTFFFGETIPEPRREEVPLRPIKLPEPKKKPVYVKEQAYDAYYLVQGTKKPKYEKIEGGLTLKSALSAMSRIVDEKISARGKVTKTKPITQRNAEGKKEKIKPLAKDTKDNYWSMNKYKFRDYKANLKGQKKQGLPTGVVIEKRKYRLDSPRERRQISKGNRRTPFGF